jgi:ADP-heptose:LPS heptosyltransferase
MVGMRKLILQNRLSPGDILMMTGTVRDLKLTYQDEYLVDVRSPCSEIFFYNPHITSLKDNDPEVELIDMQYPLIHHSGYTGLHFSDGYRLYLQDILKRKISKTSMRPEIYLNQDELSWVSPLKTEFGYEGKYWIINAGVKTDYTLKQYPYYQEVVNLLINKIKFVQVGHTNHNHHALNGVLDMRGKTNLRQLFRLSYFSEGAVCAVSLQMVIMQAFRKPCVVINGGREGMRWQAINDHSFLHTIGQFNCCLEDGCWKSKLTECINQQNNIPKCMSMIKPEYVAKAIENYYEGGRLSYA